MRAGSRYRMVDGRIVELLRRNSMGKWVCGFVDPRTGKVGYSPWRGNNPRAVLCEESIETMAEVPSAVAIDP